MKKIFLILFAACYIGSMTVNNEPQRVSACKYTGHPTSEAESAAHTKPTQEVMFTSYYPDDPTGSGSTTGSGLSTLDFDINELGWYTYQGRVVVATATYECFNSSDGACAAYNSLPEGYHIKTYGSTLTIVLDGIQYDAIVLDSCGASFWEEDYQHIDIYVSAPEYSIGKVRGQAYV